MQRLFSILTLIVILSMLAACAGATPTPAPATEEPTRAVESAPKGEPVTLTIWQPDTREAWVQALNDAIASFEAETGIKVEVVDIPWAEIQTKVQAADATNTLPDIIYALDFWGITWGAAGILQPVDDVIAAIGEDQFPPSLLQNVTVEGHKVMVPMITTSHVFWYRKDLYEQKGLKVPTTWEEILANIEALHNPPEVYGYLYYNKPPEPEILNSLMGLNDAATFDAEGNIIINSPETMEALEFLQKIVAYSPAGSNSKSENEQRLIFAEGGGAHMWSSTSFSDFLRQNPDELGNFSAFAFPPRKGNRGAVYVIGAFGISRSTPYREEAAQFLEHLMTGDTYLKFMQNTVIGFLPTTKAVAENEAYWSHERIAPFADILKAGVKAAEIAVLQGQFNGTNAWAGQVLGAGIWEEMGDRVTLGGEDPAAVAEWATEKIHEVTDQPVK